MGQLLRHVADLALMPPELGACQHSWRAATACCFPPTKRRCADAPSCDDPGEISQTGVANPQLARGEPDVCRLCPDCLHSDHVRRDADAAAQRATPQAAAATAGPQATEQARWRSFHQRPDSPPGHQGLDWPICCGDWCEFLGSSLNRPELLAPQGSHRSTRASVNGWQIGLGQPARSFARGGPPKSLREASLLRCLAGGQGLCTDQVSR